VAGVTAANAQEPEESIAAARVDLMPAPAFEPLACRFARISILPVAAWEMG
jgi:hypothetical protein